jgi:hypothetical protein
MATVEHSPQARFSRLMTRTNQRAGSWPRALGVINVH